MYASLFNNDKIARLKSFVVHAPEQNPKHLLLVILNIFDPFKTHIVIHFSEYISKALKKLN